jgi:L-amino acid N-acyltransferase YncA
MTPIRSCTEADLAAVCALYGHHVRHGTATFETEPPSLAEMAARHADVQAKGLPWLVLEADGQVQGYAYAQWFRPRAAFRYCVEDSIYLAEGCSGRGWGRALLSELMAHCEAAGMRKMVAVIGDSANAGSIGLHRALGFTETGILRGCGWKLGRWLDIVLMERVLGRGTDTPPA